VRAITFFPDAFKDYIEWNNSNKEVFRKINDLILDILRDPFKGIGKPEPLKGNWKNWWSRRITLEHRLIYKVENDSVKIISCHGHYKI